MIEPPTDFSLRRHYLTELRNKQSANFEAFLEATNEVLEPESTVEYAPFWSNQVLIPLVAFSFFMALVFI